MATFYVYVLKTLDGRVFYVGKGSGQRMFWHRHVLSRSQTKEFQRNVYKRMREFLKGQTFTEEKVFETDDETGALLHEQYLIRHYGFENLVNTQSHAFTGRKLKPEVGRIIAAKLRGRHLSLEHRAKISEAGKGRVVSPESGAKISAAKSGVPFTEAHKTALSAAAKTRKPRSAEDEEKRLRALRAALCGKHKDMTAARLARKQRHYTLADPAGKTYNAQSNGIIAFLKSVGLPTTTFYRARARGSCNGWTVKCH